MKRQILFIISIAIVIGGATFLTYSYFKTSVVQTKEFDGNLKKINGSSILVEGRPFIIDVKTDQSIGTNLVAEVVITADTKITRTTFHIPTDAVLKKTNGMFEPEKLPKEQSVVNLDALEKDFKTTHYTIGMRIVSTDNVVGKKKFIAQQIEYIFPVQ